MGNRQIRTAAISRRRLIMGSATALSLGYSHKKLNAQLRRITIGSNPAGTNFHLVAGGFAKLLQESLGIASIVRPYSGSSVYLPMMQRGEIALGINSSIDSHLAYRGLAPFTAPMTNLRALVGIYPLGYMYWTRANENLERVEDLRGRRVVVNYRGLVGLDQLNRAILATGGLSDADIEPITSAGLGEGARAVLEGRADAVAMGYRLPLVSQMHASIPGGIRFLTMGGDETALAGNLPGTWVDALEPSAATVGIEAPIRIANYQTYLNSGTHLSATDSHDIVAAIHQGWASLRQDYAVLAPVPVQNMAPVDSPLPYHDGAIQYFRETGLWQQDHDANNARFAG